MSMMITRLITRCQVPRRLSAIGQMIDQVARERFAGQCVRQLTPHWSAHPSVIRIRRLPIRLRLSSDQLDSEHLARTWATAFAQALLVALAQPTGTSSLEVIRAESRVAWLAMVISDLLIGTATQHWEYEEFREYFGLGTAEAVLALLSQEPSEAVPTLSELEARGRLDRLLAVCDDLALEQLFGVIAHGHGGTTESRLSMQDVLTVGQLAVEYGFTDLDGRQWPPFQIQG